MVELKGEFFTEMDRGLKDSNYHALGVLFRNSLEGTLLMHLDISLFENERLSLSTKLHKEGARW